MVDKGNSEEKTWMPSLKWLYNSLLIIAFLIIISFFALNILLKPYMRDIPMEITPWLDNNIETQSEQEQSK